MHEDILNRFIRNVEALRAFVSCVEPLLKSRERDFCMNNLDKVAIVAYALNKTNPEKYKLADDVIEFVEDYLKKDLSEEVVLADTVDGKKQLSFKFKDENAHPDINKDFNEVLIEMEHIGLLYRSAFISLIIYFESLIAEIFRINIEKNPDSFGIQNKTLQYSDIVELGSIEEAKKYLIDKEIEDLMFKGFDEWYAYLTNKLKLQLEYVTDNKGQLTEILVRRNLFVHNDGIANGIYMKKVIEKYRQGIQKGDKLQIDEDYIEKSIDIIERVGVLIVIEKWRKDEKQNLKYFDVVQGVGYKLLIEEKWETALEIYKILMNDKKINEADKLIALINYWQCKKWIGDFESIQIEIANIDFSALNSEYILCILALQDKYSDFFKLLPQVCPSRISLKNLTEWPVFRKVREQEEFAGILFKIESNEKALKEIASTRMLNDSASKLPRIRKLSSKSLNSSNKK